MDLYTIGATLYFGLVGVVGVGFLVLTGALESLVDKLFVRPFEKVSSLLHDKK